jgi:hypothetical protein
MGRRRSDPRREIEDRKKLKRENERLRKEIRKLSSGAPDAFGPDEPAEPPAPDKPYVETPRCPKCGSQTEILDFGIRRYYQCVKERTHRQRTV